MNKKTLLRFYLILVGLASLVTAADLYSAFISSRYLLDGAFMSLAVLLSLGCAALATISWQRPDRLSKLGDILTSRTWFWRWVVLFALLIVECVQDVLFLRADLDLGLYIKYEIALGSYFSLLVGVFTVSVLSLVCLFIFHLPHLKGRSLIKPPLSQILIPFAILFLMGTLILVLDLGYQHKDHSPGYFQPTTVPLIGVQVLVLWLGYIAVHQAGRWVVARFPKASSRFKTDVPIIIALWAVTFLLWSRVPVDPNYYLDAPRPPNQEIYLLSDSLNYEIETVSLLAGKGFSDFVEHPMYLLFHGLLHILGGNQYLQIVRFQVAVLSLIPVMIYLITRLMDQRLTGLFVAGLVILRERNQLQMMEHVSGSNVKLILTEMPSLLCLLLFIYVMLRWLQRPDRRIAYPLLAGGILGFSWLIRLELVVIIPVFVLALTFLTRSDRRQWLRRMVLFMMGLLIVISPWIYRNWRETGILFIDKYYVIKSRFGSLPERFYSHAEEGGGEEKASALESGPLHPPAGSTKVQAPLPLRLQASPLEEPSPARRGYLDHFANDVTQLFLILPSGHQPLLTVGSIVDMDPSGRGLSLAKKGLFSEFYVWRYVKSLPYYWEKWGGELAARSILPILGSMVFISLGIHRLWRRDPTGPSLLISILALYILGYSLFGSSGGRFIQVVDWIPVLLYGVGLLKILPGLSARAEVGSTGGEEASEQEGAASNGGTWRLILAGLAIAGVGLALPVAEGAFPDRYTEGALAEKMASVVTIFQGADAGVDPQTLQEFTASDQVAYGKAVYPRYYPAGERMEDDRMGTIPDDSFARIEFYLVGTEHTWVTIPLQNPAAIPHGGDVIIAGSYVEEKKVNKKRIHGRYLKASHIVVLDAEGEPGEMNLISAGQEDD